MFVHSDENLTPLMKIIIELYGFELKMKHNTNSVFVIAIVLQKAFGGLFAIRAVSLSLWVFLLPLTPKLSSNLGDNGEKLIYAVGSILFMPFGTQPNTRA